MSTKKQPAKLAKPARASRPKKSTLGAQLQAIADDTRCRSPGHVLARRGEQGDGGRVDRCEGDGIFWIMGRPTVVQPITKRRRRQLERAR